METESLKKQGEEKIQEQEAKTKETKEGNQKN